ncbi:MAG: hypothetical protein ACR2PA_03855 [Hyphomicrobiaceae bacterium]
MLIEFFGVPGCGKSTISPLVAEQLRGEGVIVSESTYVLDHECRQIARVVRKSCGLVRYAATRPVGAVRELRQIIATRQESPQDFARSAFNWLFIASVAARRRDRSSVVLLDQGVAQAIWTIGFAARKPNWLDLILASKELDALMPDAIIWVRAKTRTVSSRLAQRSAGRSRMDGRRSDNELLRRAELSCESIMTRLGSHKVQVLEVDNDKPDHLPLAAGNAAGEIFALLRPN